MKRKFSNIVYNKNTKQFGIILYKNDENKWYRINNSGCWEYKECFKLTIEQTKKLLKLDESWNNLSDENIKNILE